MLWTKKYAPKSVSEIVGQDDAISQLRDFVVNFKRQKRNAAMLFGPVGREKAHLPMRSRMTSAAKYLKLMHLT